MFRRFHFSSAGLELANAAHERATLGRATIKSGADGRHWPTQAQLMRSEIFETSMSWAGSVFGVLCRYFREEGELACLCLVSELVIQLVLLCSVLRRFVQCHR